MARTILIVNATQVVTSESNPQGLLSVVSGYPKTFDSSLSPYNGDIELTMKAAKADYYDRLGIMYGNTNANRIIQTVTLQNVFGENILYDSIGNFAINPEPVEE